MSNDTDFRGKAQNGGTVPARSLVFDSLRIGGIELFESPAGTLSVGTQHQDANSNANLAVSTARGRYRVLDGTHGETVTEGWLTEEITLSTTGKTTDSSADLLPANSESLGLVWYVTESLDHGTSLAFGDPTTAGRFATGSTGLTAGSSGVGLAHREGSIATDATGPVQTTAAKLRITLTGTQNGTGKVRVAHHVRIYGAPTS